jgi:alpha-1,3-mannosyltransferase
MALLYLAVLLFIKDRWTLGCAVFSLAVSIKMNVLLFAPGLLLLLVKRFGVFQTIPRLLLCGTIQVRSRRRLEKSQ